MDFKDKAGLIFMAVGFVLMIIAMLDIVDGFIGGMLGYFLITLVRDIASTPNEKLKREDIAYDR